MDDLKPVIAQNIIELRKKNNITQAELAEKLNYSDKAVSKWERAESCPDVSVIKQIATIFSVSVDYLLTSDHSTDNSAKKQYTKRQIRNRSFISAISIVFVWLVALFVYINVKTLADIKISWMIFVYAVPVSVILWLIFNTVWFNKRLNFLIISILVWTILLVFYLTFLSENLWLVFLLGIPAQIIILLWSGIRK